MRLLLSLPLGVLLGIALGALGGGGSILAVPALVYVVGLEPKQATTTSLVVVGVAALVGMVGHWRGGRVRVGPGLLFGIAGVAGSLLGSQLNRAVDPTVLLTAFAGLMLVAAWRMWAQTRPQPVVPAVAPAHVDLTVARGGAPLEAATHGVAPLGVPADGAAGAGASVGTTVPATAMPARARHGRTFVVLSFVAAGTVVGFMTGFFGVGGGFIIVPALVLVLGFGMPEAVGTSLLVIAINSAVALVSRLATTGVDWKVAIPFTAAAVVGSLFGNAVANRVPATKLVRWFAALLAAVALYTLVHSLATAH